MCKCTPTIRTPFCGKGNCVWPDSKPAGARTVSEKEFWTRVHNNLAPDPVRQYSDGWYFWDETWSYKHGPYENYEEAKLALHKYAKELLGDE